MLNLRLPGYSLGVSTHLDTEAEIHLSQEHAAEDGFSGRFALATLADRLLRRLMLFNGC